MLRIHKMIEITNLANLSDVTPSQKNGCYHSWIEALTLSLERQEVLILADFQILNTKFSRDKHENLIQMKNIIALF